MASQECQATTSTDQTGPVVCKRGSTAGDESKGLHNSENVLKVPHIKNVIVSVRFEESVFSHALTRQLSSSRFSKRKKFEFRGCIFLFS